MSMTDYLEAALLNHVFRNVPYTPPTVLYVGLFTAAPDEAGGGTEVSGGGYARQQAAFAAPSGGQISNSADITFPVAETAWGTITHVALFDAATGGNMLCYAALQAAKAIEAGDQLIFRAGQLVISLD